DPQVMIGDEEIRDPSEEAAKVAGVFARLSEGTASDRDWRGDRPPWSSSYLIRTLGPSGHSVWVQPDGHPASPLPRCTSFSPHLPPWSLGVSFHGTSYRREERLKCHHDKQSFCPLRARRAVTDSSLHYSSLHLRR